MPGKEPYISTGNLFLKLINQNFNGSGAVRLSPNPDRCFLYRYDGLPPVVAVEIGVVDFQSPVEGAGRGNPSKLGLKWRY